jgi:galactose mutarotase-like enzyme
MIPSENYLCIEPWRGYPALMDFDGPLMEKPGITVIEPGETRRRRVGITPATCRRTALLGRKELR